MEITGAEQNSDETSIAEPAEPVEGGRERARPFVKWAGGKGHLLPELRARVPAEFGTYFEPFLGGGAMFFSLAPRRAVLCDINREIVNAFQVVRDDVEALIEQLRSHRHSKRYYYSLRDADRQGDYWVRSSVEKASRLIYLNKTCFNGLYRVNSRGEFNVPFGDYRNPRILDEDNLRLCSAALREADIRTGSYAEIFSQVSPGDFLYLDPPYAPLSETSNFASYTKEGFGDNAQAALADFCRELDKLGARFMLSNSHTPRVCELYSGFRLEVIQAARAINSKADRRGPVEEVIVRNY